MRLNLKPEGCRNDGAGNHDLQTRGLQTTYSAITGQNSFSLRSADSGLNPAVTAGRMFGPEGTTDDVVVTVGTIGAGLSY